MNHMPTALSSSGASPIIIGHRGACAYEPENTLRSLAKAVELGVTWIEFDVRVIEDTPILFHDRSLKRCAGREGFIEGLSLAEAQALEVGKGKDSAP